MRLVGVVIPREFLFSQYVFSHADNFFKLVRQTHHHLKWRAKYPIGRDI